MFEQHDRLANEAKRAIAWIQEGMALKDEALKAHKELFNLETRAEDAEKGSREAIRAEVAENEEAISEKIVELIYKGEFDVAHLWDAFPELWQESSHLSVALGEMKGKELRAAAARCVACTACTACATCGACALCIISGVAATAGISVTSSVSSTGSYGS